MGESGTGGLSRMTSLVAGPIAKGDVPNEPSNSGGGSGGNGGNGNGSDGGNGSGKGNGSGDGNGPDGGNGKFASTGDTGFGMAAAIALVGLGGLAALGFAAYSQRRVQNEAAKADGDTSSDEE